MTTSARSSAVEQPVVNRLVAVFNSCRALHSLIHTAVAQLGERPDNSPEGVREAKARGRVDFTPTLQAPAAGSSPARRTHFPNRRWIVWGEELGRPECIFLKRWVFDAKFFSLRLHHWIKSDDARYFHDHPWWFVTFVFRGGYRDVHSSITEPTASDVVKAPAIRFRPALHKHTVIVDPGGAWTLMLTGRHSRIWGYWVKGKLLASRRYFRQFGNHPCD